MRPSDDQIRAALHGHGTRIDRYQRGQMAESEFRPVRLSYGLYYQLDHTSHMQRIKLPAGVVTVEQAHALAGIAEDFARSVLHVTTRQDVQMHWIDLGRVMEIYERLHAVGITTRGACADSIRNVTACLHAGTWEGELFDVTPYAFALHDYFLFHPLNLTQPRKFKIAFASCAYDCVQARINEIAYFPKIRDGRHGFAVYAGGGLGSQPHLAQPIRDFVPAEDALIIAEAIVRLQHRSGERKNRKRARMKYLFRKLGAKRFVAEIDDLCAQIEEQCGDALRAELREILDSFQVRQPCREPSAAPQTEDAEFAHWLRTNTYEQKQKGYYGVSVRLPLGDVTSEQFRALADLSEEVGAGEMRTANDQNVMLPWIPGASLESVYRRLGEIGLGLADAFYVSDVASCPGADFCSLAMSRSMGVSDAIRSQLEASNGRVEELGVFRIRVSGCPNSCGQHPVGDIGLTGLSLKGRDGQFHPHYSILVGGRVGEEAKLGQRLSGRFPQEEVPKVVAALTEFYRKERRAAETFADFVDRIGATSLTERARAVATVVR
jgi:sulfite reductase beta subunit-like hemoprotein